MKAVCAVAVGLLAVLAAGPGRADDKKDDKKDYAKEILGRWEITKAGNPNGAQAGSILEYGKDGKFKAVVKVGDQEFTVTGTHKVEKDKVTHKFEVMGNDVEETLTISKLTADALELTDKDGGVDVCKRLKEKEKKDD